MGDHRYNQQKTPVQSALDYLRCNSLSNRQNKDYNYDNTQNNYLYENRGQQISQFDNYQMQQVANQRYHNQMQGCFFNSKQVYQFAEPMFENNVPYQNQSNIQYFENNSMQNQQVYPSHYHANYYMDQNNNSSTSFNENNQSMDFKLKFDNVYSSNEKLGLQKEYFPEFSEDRSFEDNQEQVLQNMKHPTCSLRGEDYNRTSAVTHYIQEPLVKSNCYTTQTPNINMERNLVQTNSNSNHLDLNSFLLNVPEIKYKSVDNLSFIHNAMYTAEASMN